MRLVFSKNKMFWCYC